MIYNSGNYIIKWGFPFLEIPYLLTWVLSGIYTSLGEFNAVLYVLREHI